MRIFATPDPCQTMQLARAAEQPRIGEPPRSAALCLSSLAVLAAAWHLPLPAQTTATAPAAMGDTTALTATAAREAALGTEIAQQTEVIDGLELRVWAPPGLVANPLTLDIAADGRAYIVASARAGLLLDIRQHPDWVPEVHSLQSTEELRAFFRREMAPELSDENDWLPDYNEDGSHDYRDLLVVAERIFRVEDSDSDGIADRSTVVHEGFNQDIASDIAGGILISGDSLLVTAAPDLWRLDDAGGDGLFEQATSISHGYSVHPAFAGHDMSALAHGPDGRIYWKVGDIGFNVVDRSGRRWALPSTGAVFRAEPDGSDFEVFAWGLRNTQEIAFDRYGDLFSVDNDGDHAGETERIVYLQQGSDAGWRSNWQYGKYTDPSNNRYNVWMEERLYQPHFEGQAAYITPPIAPHHAGPSGFDYNPGTALGERWRDHFFVTSFTGGAANASVYAFHLEPQGAGFRLAEDTRIVRGLLSSGTAFGPDGALYLTDWVRGWGATGEGQLWRLDVRAGDADPLRREVQTLLQSNFAELTSDRLAALLGHADQRIRLAAQFELVARSASEHLSANANRTGDGDGNGGDTNGGGGQLARIHAIWGLGQLARRDLAHAAALRGLLGDADAEIRAQAAKTLGDARDAASTTALIERLGDADARVRSFAAEALGRIGARTATTPIAAMLAANGDSDVYLRSAGINALAGIGDRPALAALAGNPSSAVRLAAVVALRRLQDRAVADFLDDPDPLVVIEAGRAINDEGGIAGAVPALAEALAGNVRSEPFVRRAISANLRLGSAEAAMRVADFAADPSAAEALRVESVAVLGVWAAPSSLDRVDGAWLGQLDARNVEAARLAVARLLPLLDEAATSAAIKVELLDASVSLDLTGAASYALRRLEQDSDRSVRIGALRTLHAVGGSEAEQAVSIALDDPEAEVRMAALDAMPDMPVPADVRVAALVSVIDDPARSTGEQQRALAALGAIGAPATPALQTQLDRLAAGEIPAALQLDLLEAAIANGAETLLTGLDDLGVGRRLERLAATLPRAYEVGGSAQRGQQLSLQHPAAQCTRCHVIGAGESLVGPDLTGVGNRLSRPELVESLLEPSARITAGFGEQVGASAMPPMGTLLEPRQIRDIVEFLATQR